jgi:ribosomal RNA-processing protein 9
MEEMISIHGIVNSLQVVQVPRNAVSNAVWYADGTSTGNGVPHGVNGTAGKESKAVLVVAAIGQEPRTGRWLSVREGAKNCGLVVQLQIVAS